MHVNKKCETPPQNSKKEVVTINDIIVGATSRGLSFEGAKEMTIGQIVDYCYTWNEANDPDNHKKSNKRNATQAEWDSFLG